jgi:hypothetical protein
LGLLLKASDEQQTAFARGDLKLRDLRRQLQVVTPAIDAETRRLRDETHRLHAEIRHLRDKAQRVHDGNQRFIAVLIETIGLETTRAVMKAWSASTPSRVAAAAE